MGKRNGKTEVGKSYELTGMVVRDFRGRKFLSTSKEKSSIEIVEAVGEVVKCEMMQCLDGGSKGLI